LAKIIKCSVNEKNTANLNGKTVKKNPKLGKSCS